jgi:GMP synthase-like glutamine amidotransferase
MTSQNPGIFRDFAESRNIAFHEIDLHAGESIPELNVFDGLWVMGGSMNVWEEDQYPWLIEEKKAIRHAVEDLKMPFLGICLGHQLLAEALGGEAKKTDNHEIGLFEIKPTTEGRVMLF